ncbi:MAG: hypothetical protein CMN06_05540 [Roseibacillus sp.]|nr:hypothetical protein [Roseibacillus sp.]|tara:strand:- start:3679 stop:4272 length:594 start_codon:yes stop_codon:yes gene_type:complete
MIWTLVLAAQGYFRGMRRTADNLGKVVEESTFRDWSGKTGEPSGKEREVRNTRIREVVSGLTAQEFNPDTKVRLIELRTQFYSKLSKGEREVFVTSLLEGLDTYIMLFDSLPGERRRKLVKRAVKAAREELPSELRDKYELLDAEEEHENIGEIGWRAAMENKEPDKIMEFLQLIEIAGELIQRMRIPQWEGARGDK